MARVVKGSVRFGSILASTAMLSCAQELPSDRAEGPTSSGDTFVATLLHGESTSFVGIESSTDGQGPDNLAGPTSDPQPIVEGFALDVSKTVGGDLKIEWDDQEVDEYEVWTSINPYFVPDGPGAVLVTTTEDLCYEVSLGGEAYYRIRAVGAEQEHSTAVGQIEHDLHVDYNKFGMCLVSEVDTWVELAGDLDTWPNQGYIWNPATQAWITGTPLNSETFDAGEVVIARYASAPTQTSYSWIGHVPVESDVTINLLPGSNFVATLPLGYGPIWASELYAMIPDVERVGSPDPVTQAEMWYPEDPDWLMPTCAPVIVEVTEGSEWPPVPSGGGGEGGDDDGGEDDGGEAGEGGSADDGGDEGGGEAPPDPAELAPPLDPGVTTSFFDAISFLVDGDPAVQIGVAPGTIDPNRAAVLRGEVRQRDVGPIAGVVVSAVGHPEYGTTRTRDDGRYDFVVNGGQRILLEFSAEDLISAQRTVVPGWQENVEVDRVALVPLDSEMSVIDFVDPIEIHVSSEVTDADGTRTNVLMFREGTVATMVLPNEAEEELESISVRATEFTVGPEGPDAMPGNLPPASAYTYAVDYTIEEAAAAGAERVVLDPPAIAYLENFVGFPVGGNVPLGAYDVRMGTWSAEPDGQVIEILGEAAGLATIDSTGDGVAEDATALAALGIDADEREALAELYGSGTELWRMPVPHMSWWDANWGFGPPPGAGPPPPGPVHNPQPPDDPCLNAGSIIECESQILGEQLPIVGTDLSLNYRSDRVPGSSTYELRVPIQHNGVLSPIPLPPGAAEVRIEVAGRHFSTVYDPYTEAEDQLHTFVWDGYDAYGRRPQGPVPVSACVFYEYPVHYYETRGENDPAFGYNGNGVAISSTRTSSTLKFTQCHAKNPVGGGLPIDAGGLTKVATTWGKQFALGTFDARRGAVALGGWTLSAHHTLAPEAGVLYLGTGERISSASANSPLVITHFAGTSSNAPLVDDGMGGPAIAARIGNPAAGVMGPEGSIYFTTGNRVRRIGPDGVIHHFAGATIGGFGGDGGPASTARLSSPRGLAIGPDGSVYIADNGNRRVRRVDPDGIITTVVGSGALGSGGDGGPAIAAAIAGVVDVEVARDGSLYVLQGDRIRRVTPGGTITRFAGGAACGGGPDGMVAVDTCLSRSRSMALGHDGSVYVLYQQNSSYIDQIYRIGVDGVMHRIAGATVQNPSTLEEGIAATDAWIDDTQSIEVSSTGLVYFSDSGRARVRFIDVDGSVNTLVGTGVFSSTGDRGPGQQATVNGPWGVFLGHEGSLYILEGTGRRIRRLSGVSQGFSLEERVMPSPDHREIWVFDAGGRHLRTLDAIAGIERYSFGYDEDGLLVTVTDEYAATTEIIRDGGLATAIVGPDGHETTLAMATSGYLESMTNPAGEMYSFGYDGGGLLTELVTPNEELHTFDYVAGKLVLDTGAEGGSSTIERIESGTYLRDYEVEITSTLGRTKTVALEHLSQRRRQKTVTHPDGTEAAQITFADGTQEITQPDGTVIRLGYFPDSRFGMVSPTLRREVETPGGVLMVQQTSRNVTYTDPPEGLLNLSSVEESLAVNGRMYQRTYDVAAGTAHMTTPEGRESNATFDVFGRMTLLEAPGVEPIAIAYDDRGRIEEATVGTGLDARVWTFAYDTEGNLISTTDPLSRVTEMTYDPIGRVLSGIAPDEAVTELAYDDSGNLTTVTPPGRPAHGFVYDGDDRNTDYVPPDLGAGTETTHYVYDADDALVEVHRPNAQVIEFFYDDGGRLESFESPDGTTEVTYDPLTGHVTEVEGPSGARILYSYDGSLVTDVETTGDAAALLSFAYDDDMRRESMTVEGVTYPIAYDDDGLLTSIGDVVIARNSITGFPTAVTVGEIETAVAFDPTGALASLVSEVGATELLSLVYERDALGRIVTVTETPVVEVGDDGGSDDDGGEADGGEAEGGEADGGEADDGEAEGGEAEGGEVEGGNDDGNDEGPPPPPPPTSGAGPTGSPTGGDDDGGAEADGGGAEADGGDAEADGGGAEADGGGAEADGGDDGGPPAPPPPPTEIVTEYTYDLAGRLESVTVNSELLYEYEYDANGNRESVTTPSGTVTAEFDDHDRLVEQGGIELEYAVTGELLMRVEGSAITQYEHDAFGRLRALELPDATLIEYDLDARGRRVGKRVDSVLQRAWVYDGELDPVAELDGAGDVVMRFVYGSAEHVPDLIERGSDTYRVVTDHLGSVRLVVHADTGVVEQRLEYGPWGEVLVDTNPGFQPFGFAGGIYDPDTGLVQFGAREYDADLGRWISRDPVLFDGGANLFAYAANDPINAIDPTGEAAQALGVAALCGVNPHFCYAMGIGVGAAFSAMIHCFQTGICQIPPFPDFNFNPFPKPRMCEPVVGDSFSKVVRKIKHKVPRKEFEDDPEEFERCEQACAAGGQVLKAYCATLPAAAQRARCYSKMVESETNCYDWCGYEFGG